MMNLLLTRRKFVVEFVCLFVDRYIYCFRDVLLNDLYLALECIFLVSVYIVNVNRVHCKEIHL